MAKKYYDRKEIKQLISNELKSGKSKHEILIELDEAYYENDLLTRQVAGAAQPSMKTRFKLLNILLALNSIALLFFQILDSWN